jgi:flagellar hook-length control protein FliK
MPTIPTASAQQAMPTDPSLSASPTSRGNGPSVPVQGKDRRVENEVAVLAAMPQMAMPTEISVASSSPSVSASVLLPEAVREIARRENLSLAVTELCETMEVRHGALLGEGEVRLTLQPTVLSGSVVRLTCERGEVAVHFAAATEQVERLLLAAQPMLLARLAESTPLPVSMTVARGLAEEDFRRRS